MLTKLETKSNRVKGLSFHPKRPWILASLHNGLIQLWDYRIRTLLDRFDEHDGPVRGISFHATQPLFVSGGDDYKIKVWNYKLRRCLFTLLGHMDYIRTVQFHHEYPWILSASDDQTIRIWNWQSRTCIAVLTGHNHYVMSAYFHPKEDLVVSASLDQTVRIWDISGLKKKNVSPTGGLDDPLRLAQNDLFGNPNVVVKYVLEGHDRGVNWAAFHPSLPLIVSGADDRSVKLWRMNDTKAWEVDTLRGHYNNVSCVIFHPHQELILSNSEDKTIRVWDMSKRSAVQTFRREHDRFWIIAAHPENNLFAAGHDSGLIVFKLERERPAYVAHKGALFYVKERYLRTYDFASARDVPVMSIRRAVAKSPRSLSYNPAEKAVLLFSDADGGTYEFYKLPADGRSADSVESKKGAANSAVFIKRNRFAALDAKAGQLHLKNLKCETVKRLPMPPGTDMIFAAGLGSLLLRAEDKIILYDLQQKRAVAELTAPNIKYVIWDDKGAHVALLGKDTLVLATRKLEQECIIHETMRIKSGAWEESGVFLYTTVSHMKYCLRDGEHGIVRTLDVPIYVTGVRGNQVHCLDREGRNRVVLIDPTEYAFKMALAHRRYADVLKMVKPGQSNLVGQAIIAYLQRKGYPEVALYFVKDDKTKFNLALECGNIEVAQACAKALDDKDAWHRLGTEALRQGNHQVVEMAYQRTKNFERLSFLYLITGNVEKLHKMLKIAEMRNDTMGRFHNALYLGDVHERVRILEEVGQFGLAYTTAATHGLAEDAARLAEKLDGNLPPVPEESATRLMVPPAPILRHHDSNWPLLTVSPGFFDPSTMDDSGRGIRAAAPGLDLDLDEGEEAAGAWDDTGADLGEEGEGEGLAPSADLGNDEDDGGAGWDDDGGLDGLDSVDLVPAKAESFFVAPRPGQNARQVWTKNSRHAADHAAAGSIESAMELLHQQVGVVNFAPLRPHFMALWMGAHAASPSGPLGPAVISNLERIVEGQSAGLPALWTNVGLLIEQLKAAYRSTTKGAFGEALDTFASLLHMLVFVVAPTRQARTEVEELRDLCREYILGLRMELHKKTLPAQNQIEALELAAYFTHCNLQPIHRMLALRSAMKAAYRIKCYHLAASFASRLLELSPKPEIAQEAKKVIKFAETNNTDAHTLNYDERNPFVVCGISFTPIYKNRPSIECPYCHTHYLPAHAGKLCPTCQLSEIGKETSGIKFTPGRD